MFLIVGLGNPGKEYENTRHNIGFMAVDALAARSGVKIARSKCGALVEKTRIEGQTAALAKPQTFMNLSGESIRELLNWFKTDTEHLILIYDDVDLEVGELRLRRGGGSGGHKGVQSVIDSLGTENFIRVRIGIGRDSFEADTSEYVLQKIPSDQKEKLAAAVSSAAEAASATLKDGLDRAMNIFNRAAE